MPSLLLPEPGAALDDRAALLSGGRWKEHWLPVLANGGGEYYLLDADHGGAIRHYQFDEPDEPIEYNSLDDLMDTITAAFEQILFFVDENGYLEMDDLVFAQFAASRNSSAPGWCERTAQTRPLGLASSLSEPIGTLRGGSGRR